MSELRAPDPTLTDLRSLPVCVTWMDNQVRAHKVFGCQDRLLGTELEAEDARWFAVPCRECFPDAPEPGRNPGPWCGAPPTVCSRPWCTNPDHYPHPNLAWQVPDREVRQ